MLKVKSHFWLHIWTHCPPLRWKDSMLSTTGFFHNLPCWVSQLALFKPTRVVTGNTVWEGRWTPESPRPRFTSCSLCKWQEWCHFFILQGVPLSLRSPVHSIWLLDRRTIILYSSKQDQNERLINCLIWSPPKGSIKKDKNYVAFVSAGTCGLIR